MAVNEEIVTGKKFRRLIDVATNKWRRYSFWNKAKDTECEDGTDVETKVGAIKGITTSTNVSETGYAADAKTVSEINQSLTNIPIFRCGRIRVSYDSPQYLKANVVFDKEMPSYDYSVTIGIDSNVIDCTAIYYENRSVHGFGISIYKADAKFTSVDGVNLSWIAAM